MKVLLSAKTMYFMVQYEIILKQKTVNEALN